MSTSHDKTSTRRQHNRRRALNLAAQALGYPTWGKLETALIRGEIAIKIEKPPAQPHDANPHLPGADAARSYDKKGDPPK